MTINRRRDVLKLGLGSAALAAQGRRAIAATAHWYDLIVADRDDPRWLRRLSGHVETGRPSLSDPAIGHD